VARISVPPRHLPRLPLLQGLYLPLRPDLDHRDGEEAGVRIWTLMAEWNPIFASVDFLRAIMGEPTFETPALWEYRFDSGFSGDIWKFGVERGTVTSVERLSLE
jgi:hypothetical protein